MAAGLRVVVLCLISGLWIVEQGECSAEAGDGCTASCPTDWSHFKNHCFQYQKTKMEWADAERFCTEIGANLASIHSEDEYQFVRQLINRAAGKDEESWLGGYDAAKEGVWLWSCGKEFEFNHWANGEPNNHGGGEDCMEINFQEKDFINDAKCDQKQPFTCVKPL